mmetsp:Transcript_7902/g.25359  ORF Transcript_7902/g.25359 Transcript_7902/m.25359 type:complete len:506 (-) Transcript_7902:91-1608(-)
MGPARPEPGRVRRAPALRQGSRADRARLAARALAAGGGGGLGPHPQHAARRVPCRARRLPHLLRRREEVWARGRVPDQAFQRAHRHRDVQRRRRAPRCRPHVDRQHPHGYREAVRRAIAAGCECVCIHLHRAGRPILHAVPLLHPHVRAQRHHPHRLEPHARVRPRGVPARVRAAQGVWSRRQDGRARVDRRLRQHPLPRRLQGHHLRRGALAAHHRPPGRQPTHRAAGPAARAAPERCATPAAPLPAPLGQHARPASQRRPRRDGRGGGARRARLSLRGSALLCKRRPAAGVARGGGAAAHRGEPRRLRVQGNHLQRDCGALPRHDRHRGFADDDPLLRRPERALPHRKHLRKHAPHRRRDAGGGPEARLARGPAAAPRELHDRRRLCRAGARQPRLEQGAAPAPHQDDFVAALAGVVGVAERHATKGYPRRSPVAAPAAAVLSSLRPHARRRNGAFHRLHTRVVVARPPDFSARPCRCREGAPVRQVTQNCRQLHNCCGECAL